MNYFFPSNFEIKKKILNGEATSARELSLGKILERQDRGIL